MISASRCKLLSKGAGACARAGSHERLRPTKPTMGGKGACTLVTILRNMYRDTPSGRTPAADLVIRRYLEEGSKIAREVTARYAN